MSNMSYCRFVNTLDDLEDCRDALERLLNGEPDADQDGETALSGRELKHAKDLVALCQDVVDMVAEYVGEDVDDLTIGDIDAALDQAQARALEADAEEGKTT